MTKPPANRPGIGVAVMLFLFAFWGAICVGVAWLVRWIGSLL